MGSYRFRLSDMIPNAWFYKLKDMGRPRNHSNADPSKEKQYQISPPQPSKIKQPHQFYPRKSYYFTRELIPIDGFYVSPTNTKSTDAHFPEPSRKSCKKRPRKRIIRSTSKLVTSSVSADCSCRDTIWSKDDSPPDYSASLSSSSSSDDGSSSPQEFRSDFILSTESFDNMASWSRSCSTRKVMNSKANDIAIDADNESFVKKFDKLDEFDNLSELELPPIITKPAKFNDMVKGIKNNEPTKCRRSSAKFAEKITHGSLSVKVVKEERITVKENNKNTTPVRKFSVNSPGVRLRINSPKIASRRIQGHGHGRKSMSSSSSSSSSGRSLSGSFAVVKSSFDPQRDFRDSMVEMIMENNITASKDLEDLLACYLSLNSDEYHDLIIKVFKQIWFDLSDVQLK